MTRDQEAVQAIARAISEGVIVRCAECGQISADTVDGRHRHKMLYDHPLSGPKRREVR